jgi:hypothetical protein
MLMRDDGGSVGANPLQNGIGGATPTSQTMNPVMQGMIQRYSSLPTEKLQEMASMMGGTQQGQIIQQVLRQKQLAGQPQAQQPQAQQPGMQTQPQTVPQMVRRGGPVRRADGGGTPGQGFLNGATMGRADAVQTTAPGGSYILPADVISALGEGNSIAGAKVMDQALSTGPGGIPISRGSRGSGPPRAPQAYPIGQAKGGATPHAPSITPVMLSDGEYVVAVPDVARIGGGDIKKGHRMLDKFVLDVRKAHIKKLMRLPGPVKT